MSKDDGKRVFDVAIVGLGLIGSAACKYLSKENLSVVGIGPGEPKDWKNHDGVFASYYDEGRLTRIVDKDPVWSLLAARSIANYKHIQEESGHQFHQPVGSLRVTPFSGHTGDSLDESHQQGAKHGASLEVLGGVDALRHAFPYMAFCEDDQGLLERGGAGYINPRSLVTAQHLIAQKHGACIVRDTVLSLVSSSTCIKLMTAKNGEFYARKVLLSADAWTNEVLPYELKLDIRPQAVSVVLAEVEPPEANRLRSMPSLIYRLAAHSFLHSIYACPPIKYPDGKLYVKIGGTVWSPVYKYSHSELLDWFHGAGDKVETDSLYTVLVQLLPEADFVSVKCKPCIVSYTRHSRPYIDMLEGSSFLPGQLFVATGGSGAAAKSSDEIGRIAALLVTHGDWKHDIDRETFKAVYLNS